MEDFPERGDCVWMVIPIEIFCIWEEFTAFGSAPEDTVGETVRDQDFVEGGEDFILI